MWIWQQTDWPNFRWDNGKISQLLRQINFNQGLLLGKLDQDPSAQITLDTLLANIIHSSAIEGEKLNAFSVRSSLANKLGVSDKKPFPTTVQTDGLAEMTLDALQNWQSELTLTRILNWHHLLFPEGHSLFNSIQGGTLRGEEPMQVVSGRIDKPKVHFEAPPRSILDGELEQFIAWFNHSRHDTDLDPLIRAAITHLWFVTLHPLDDGNGRITRLLTDLALTQAEHRSIRFYAMSVTVLERRQAYYEMLETSQKGELDITTWLVWFLDTLNASLQKSLDDIAQTVAKTNYWQRVEQTLSGKKLTTEQVKVLNRLLDGEFELGISSSQYQKVAKVSRATATRHLAQLVEQKCLVRTDAGGRSTRYLLASK
ncbi:Fic family protein [Shewanella nanhaiensis]|uniref:Fic family protein n=1 Tax=Shewanella nanhaiensis TaxID=2864872 RepID=A0ABS7EAA8_9GAMM|nr:Fic family protein [Shewanella nanhaiensis]MBW8186091.1 Fic family protein [Shewanella nanhaiensis]